MANINELKNEIAEVLHIEKSYELPSVCIKFGLDSGDEVEANQSKRTYVKKRLASKGEEFILDLAKKLSMIYDSPKLTRIISGFSDDNGLKITSITRRKIIDEIILLGNLSGKLEITDFLRRIWEIQNMPSTDSRFSNAAGDIAQHMIYNDDWTIEYLLITYFDMLYISDNKMILFLENLVHPLIREDDEQMKYVDSINKHLENDNYSLKIVDYISGHPLYNIVDISKGVKGRVKNLIFASDGLKPEIVLSDSINNDIKIVKNEEHCLVYDLPIQVRGLKWTDLVKWWADSLQIELSHENSLKTVQRSLYSRLYKSLDSEPEKLLFKTYYSKLNSIYMDKLPALIPQVYLHYDPYTIKQLKGQKRLPRQRMDFLIIFSSQHRIVIEVDGKQHYADGDVASPKRYAEMVAADRDIKLNGYEVYRFGGYELQGTNGEKILGDFFIELMKKYIG